MSDDLTIAYMLGVEDMRSRLHKQADEIERLKREAAIRIDQIDREQEAHLRTIADYNRAAVENEKLREALTDAAGELQHAYIMGFTERYRDAAKAARAAAAAIRDSGE